MPKMNKVAAAIIAYGGQKKLGNALGITHVAVRKWIDSGRVPFERLSDFCLRTGLRPSVANPVAFEHAKEIVQLEQEFENRNR